MTSVALADTIGSLAVSGSRDGADRVARRLRASELSARGLGRAEVLVVRHVSIDRTTPVDVEGRVNDRLAASIGAAARPRRGRIAPGADAVRFSDEAELLACLLVAVIDGRPDTAWWARYLVGGMVERTATAGRHSDRRSGGPAPAAERDLSVLLVARPRLVPAAFSHLARWHRADDVAISIPAAELAAVTSRVASEHGIESPTAGRVSSPGDPTTTVGGPATDDRLDAFRRVIEAAVARFADGRVFVDTSSRPRPGAAPVTASSAADPVTTTVAIQPPPAGGIEPATAERADGPDRPPAASSATAGTAPAAARPGDLTAQPDPSIIGPPPEAGGDEPADRTGPTVTGEAGRPDRPGAATTPILDDLGGVADPSARGVARSSAEPAVLGEPTSIVTTGLVGLFYLLNPIRRLGLPAALGVEANVWRFLAEVGRVVVPTADDPDVELDPVWSLLAELGPPDAAVGGSLRIPEHWPEPRPELRSDGSSPLQEAATATVTHLCAGMALEPDGLRRLVVVPGVVTVTATHLDVDIPMDHVDLTARRLGLDADVGWYPECGRIVRFHFGGHP